MVRTMTETISGILLLALLLATIAILLWIRREREWRRFREEWESNLKSYLDLGGDTEE